jgi:pimeloyl-ACP methyl ester carboxylesterase
MSPRRSSAGRKTLKALLPIALVILLAIAGATAWLVYTIAHPPTREYVITPEGFARLSGRALAVTQETWQNRDGTEARGWLLRGTRNEPAIVLLHGYGQDRSWVFNLGVSLNETGNFTILWPDLRGHGMNPPVAATSFGAREADDVAAALDFLRRLEVEGSTGTRLTNNRFGIYGFELGSYAALLAGTRDPEVRALALDSVPASPDELMRIMAHNRTHIDNGLLRAVTRAGARLYYFGRYDNTTACAAAASLGDRRVLLLSGANAGELLNSTQQLAGCLPNPSLAETHFDLALTGVNLASSTGQQGETYASFVKDFFNRALRATP